MNSPRPSPAEASHTALRSGVSRRHLVRAGLTAGPVVAALKTNTVLAGAHTCIKPSTFSSLTAAHMKVSQGREISSNFQCHSPERWAGSNQSLAPDYKTKTLFLSEATGFRANPGGIFTGKTLQQVLEMGKVQQNVELARYVAASYLTAVAYNDRSDMVLLTRKQCRDIWNGQGIWSPFKGSTWTRDQTLGYFSKIFGPAFL